MIIELHINGDIALAWGYEGLHQQETGELGYLNRKKQLEQIISDLKNNDARVIGLINSCQRWEFFVVAGSRRRPADFNEIETVLFA